MQGETNDSATVSSTIAASRTADNSPNLRAVKTVSLVLIGASFRNSNIAFRERFVKYLESPDNILSRPQDSGVLEYAALVTCNRVEAYVTSRSPETLVNIFMTKLETEVGNADDSIYIKTGRDAIKHVFRVAAGLDSLVVGEDQILSQLREASVKARVSGASRSVLTPLFESAMNVGRKAKVQIRLSDGSNSIAALALKFSLDVLKSPPAHILLVGTGRIARLTVSAMKNSKIYMASRHKRSIPGFKNVTLVRPKDMKHLLNKCELVIAASAAKNYVIKKRDLLEDAHPLIIDLGFPRNVDPRIKSEREGLVYDLDDLANYSSRTSGPFDLKEMEDLIEYEADKFDKWLTASKLSPSLANLYKWAEELRVSETAAAKMRIRGGDESVRKVLDVMGRRIVSKILSRPTLFVKGSTPDLPQGERLRLLEEVFGLDGADQ